LLFITLVHFPVINSEGEIIASAVANLDILDISRTARTYGVEKFFVVTPLEDQQRLVEEIVTHWVTGSGGKKNPCRKDALELVEICQDLDAALTRATEIAGAPPRLYATSGKDRRETVPWEDIQRQLHRGEHLMLLFGTAHGLAEEAIARCSGVISPIRRGSSYRHLPVRSAVAICLDRLLGDTILPHTQEAVRDCHR